jgi:signal transduction histidine kinase
MPVSVPATRPCDPDLTHDLRNALASVRSLSEILRDNPSIDSGRQQQFLGIILTETERSIGLLDHLPHAGNALARASND